MKDTVGWRRLTGEGLSDAEKAVRDAADTRDALRKLDPRAINAAVKAAGGSARSERTLRRWKQRGHIPDEAVADLVRRRAAIAELGGVKAAAAALGRSAGAVYDWQAGRTHDLSKDAGKTMHRHEVLAAARRHANPPRETKKKASKKKRSGAAVSAPKPPLPRPRISLTGTIAFVGDGTKYPPRERTIDLSTAQWPERDVEEMIVAIDGDDMTTVQQVIERVATEGWATGGGGYDRTYDDANGFRIERIDSAHFYLG